MSDKKVGLSDTMKAKTEQKPSKRNSILGTKFTIAISMQKVVLNLLLLQI